ncbi:glycosyl hydrolase [Pantoea sp. Tr-811]|uniref:beta-glucosidase family protein n=1 Tax=Pantoea sp. Tr-811 TaxID=2608361 RepID=UPI0014207903|nr:glycoside hydrolase family 3 C-terminal domain-containing protein [Pantoea sp. Tr-811]NIF28947.1 glycosyl hydrolase [Pantoea sp. Tr-811]
MKKSDIVQLIAAATLEEKVNLLSGKGLWKLPGIERLGVPEIILTDGTYGVRYSESQIDDDQSWSMRDFYAVVGQSASEVDSEREVKVFGRTKPATCFPNGSSVGCSWNTELARHMGVALGKECRHMGVNVLLGPGINLRRTPLAGRAYEYYSEDPVLTAGLASALIQGLQSTGVGACLKHFACNNSEYQRTTMDSVVDERALRELYLEAFRRVIRDADPWSLMTSYNRLNGVQASEHTWLLTNVLREEWGYQGLVMSDWYGTKDRVRSFQAGNELTMPEHHVDRQELYDAVLRGEVSMAAIDEAVERALVLIERTTFAPGKPVCFESHHALAQEIARESIVLLKNEHDVLPITADKYKSLCVLGPTALKPTIQGSGCATTVPWMLDRPLDEILDVAGDSFEVRYDPGVPDDPATGAITQQAQHLVRNSDVVVIFVSTPVGEDGENGDRKDLFIQPSDARLLEAVGQLHNNVVVVMASSDSVVMPWLEGVPALLGLFYAGQGMGRAVADILFGNTCPSGKLTTTAPNSLQETPAFLGYPGENGRHHYSESIHVGYRYYDARAIAPAFPFGFGLSYTSFSYEQLDVCATKFRVGERIQLTVRVRNVGPVVGKEVVQVYVSPPQCRLARSPQELKAFAKLSIDVDCVATFTLAIEVEDLAYYDPALGQWVVEPGQYELRVGGSSRHIALTTTVQVVGTVQLPPLAIDASLLELIERPRPFAIICERYAKVHQVSVEQAGQALREVAPEIFVGLHIALTSMFAIDISRQELADILELS